MRKGFLGIGTFSADYAWPKAADLIPTKEERTAWTTTDYLVLYRQTLIRSRLLQIAAVLLELPVYVHHRRTLIRATLFDMQH